MESGATSAQVFSFRLDPAGKELVVFLKCTGIATGSYSFRFEFPGKTTQTKEGDIEIPEKHRFSANEGLSKILVKVKSVPFLASDPGGYQVAVEQVEGKRFETPPLGYSSQAEILIETDTT
jgi:hypothetical protein